jgi:SLT domain-containing protein
MTDSIGSAWISIGAEGQAQFAAQARAIAENAVKSINPNITVGANTTPALTKLAALKTATAGLQSGLADLRVNANTTPAIAKVVALQARAAALNKSLNNVSPNVNDDGLLSSESRMLAIAAASEKMGEALEDAGNASGAAGDAVERTSGSYGLFGKIIKTIATANIPLFAASMDHTALSVIPGFGDALDKLLPHFLINASGLHMAMEAVIEFTAVWLPAGVAMAAFAAAAAPEAIKIYDQLDNMNTAAKATGQTFADFPKLTGDLTNALKPQLLELYGIALQGVDSSSGKLGPALDDVAQGVDSVAAKVVAWMQGSSGNGLSNFLKSGATDAGMLADGFVQVGRILQTVLESVPGYAKILLGLGDACLTAMADVVKFVQPVIAAFLKIHGAVFYIGLATTMVMSFGRAMVLSAAATAFGATVEETSGKLAGMGSAIGSLIGGVIKATTMTYAYTASLVALAGEEGVAAAASKVIADGMESIPFGPAGLAAAAFAAVVGVGLFEAFHSATSEVTLFVAAQNKMVAASNVANLQVDIANAIQNTAAQVQVAVAAQNKLSSATYANSAAGREQIASMGGIAQAAMGYRAAVSQTNSALDTYVGELQTATPRVNDLVGAYSNVNAVMGLMTLAGIKQSSLATETNKQFAQQVIELKGVAQGYGLMTEQGGAMGAQLDTLNISTSDAYKALQTLTSAEAGWLTLVTGGVSDLSSFESGMSTLQSAQSTLATSMKTLSTAQKTYGTSNKTLSADQQAVVSNTLAQQSAFAAQVNSAGTLLGSLQSLSSALDNTKTSQGEVTTAMKGAIAQMLPFAKGSQTNTAMLSDLAQVVGGPATSNYQTLAKWVGNTTSAQSNALTATDKLTTANDNLSNAAKNLASALSNDITQGQAATLMSNGLTTAQTAFGKTLANSNDTLTNSVKLAGDSYYNAMIKAGVSTSSATGFVDSFMRQQGYSQTAISQMNNYLDQQSKKLQAVQTAAQQAQGALKSYAGGSPYNATVNTTVGADGTVQVTGAGPGLNDVLAKISFRGQGFAAGGVVPGGSPGGDNHLAMVKSGELIIPSQHAARFGSMAKAAGIPGFAAGGVVGAVQQVNNTDQSGMQSGAQQVMAQAVKTLTSYAKNQTENGTPVNYNATAGVAQWKSIVLQALAMNGLPASLLNQVLYQMQTESGGNPNAQNNTDSNAAAGDPSRGLLQTIGTTFAAYHIAGTSENIFNPLANVAAAINYAKHVYGPNLMNQYGGLGSGHGYSAGGVLPEKIMGVGVTSGNPYAFGSGEQVTPAGEANAANASGLPGMNQYQANTMISLLEKMVKLGQQAPQSYANSLNAAVSTAYRGAIG